MFNECYSERSYYVLFACLFVLILRSEPRGLVPARQDLYHVATAQPLFYFSEIAGKE